MIVFLVILRGRRAWETFRNIGFIGVLAGVIWGFSNMLFVSAVQSTAVANVLVILASNPMFASIFSYAMFREKGGSLLPFIFFLLLRASYDLIFGCSYIRR
jgi:drug/metabolite transporter (DMT)-like permease